MCFVIDWSHANPLVSVQLVDSITERFNVAFVESRLAATETPDTVSISSVYEVLPIFNYYTSEGLAGGEDDNNITVGNLIKEKVNSVVEGLVAFFRRCILDVISSMEETTVVGNNVGICIGMGGETVSEFFNKENYLDGDSELVDFRR